MDSGAGVGRDLHSIHCDIHSGEACSHEPTCPMMTREEIREMFPSSEAHADLTRITFAAAMRGAGAVRSEPPCDPCPECKHHRYHEPECSINVKRLAMQAQLEQVNIDVTKLRPRVPRRRVHVVGIETRTTIAKEVLLAMIGNGGDKLDKVRAAVEYTDLLLSELGGGVQPFGGDDDE